MNNEIAQITQRVPTMFIEPLLAYANDLYDLTSYCASKEIPIHVLRNCLDSHTDFAIDLYEELVEERLYNLVHFCNHGNFPDELG